MSKPKTIAAMSLGLSLCGALTTGSANAVVAFTHCRNVVLSEVGSGVSAMTGGAVLLSGGWFDASEAVLLYPSNVRANDDAR
jgi:hypothetical protein